MKIEHKYIITDNEGSNIDEKICLFRYSSGRVVNPADRLYGISEAEINPKQNEKVGDCFTTLGIYHEDKGWIQDLLYDRWIPVESITLLDVLVLNKTFLLNLICKEIGW